MEDEGSHLELYEVSSFGGLISYMRMEKKGGAGVKVRERTLIKAEMMW